MRYLDFTIENYRAIKKIDIGISKERIIPLIGINECGKTTILQAIYCFDCSNDTYNEGKHLRDVINLYELEHNSPAKISATLSVSREEFKDIYTAYAYERPSRIANAQGTDTDAIEQQASIVIAEQQKKLIEWWEDKRNLHITRELSGTEPRYTTVMLDNKDINEQLANIDIEISDIDHFVRVVLAYGPHILYSDDFNDRPPTDIDIPTGHNEPITDEWQAIYNTLFKQSSSKLSLYSVANEPDHRVQASQLAQVQHSLNEELKEAWQTFLPRKEQEATDPFTIQLSIDKGENKKMHITVAESAKDGKGAKKTFSITDRSKGFVWYFTLVMKILYNPKAHRQRSNGNSIFLLDEPGSYLHADAQSELCKKLKGISQEHGTVIYCTHTPYLLNPESIATHKVRIIEKDNNNNILWRSPELKSSRDIPGSEKPLFEALHLPYFHSLDAEKPFVLVEGIYDAYTLRLFIEHKTGFLNQPTPSIVPASGAHSIIQLLSYFIGFDFKYAALWDNDTEGRKKHTKAVREFGDIEAKRFMLLQHPKDATGKITKMEQLFTDSDLKKIATELELNIEQNTKRKPLYQKAILALFSAEQKKQQSIIDGLSKETHDNFDALLKAIATALEK